MSEQVSESLVPLHQTGWAGTVQTVAIWAEKEDPWKRGKLLKIDRVSKRGGVVSPPHLDKWGPSNLAHWRAHLDADQLQCHPLLRQEQHSRLLPHQLHQRLTGLQVRLGLLLLLGVCQRYVQPGGKVYELLLQGTWGAGQHLQQQQAAGTSSSIRQQQQQVFRLQSAPCTEASYPANNRSALLVAAKAGHAAPEGR